MERDLPPLVEGDAWPTALAPMQDVTTLPFMSLICEYGAPDYFVTEYFRVHEHSTLEPHILASIEAQPGDRPVFAQLIGEHEDYMVRAARELEQYPIAGVDLNMGCPAPKVFKKNVGGGLLRDPQKVDRLLGVLRDTIAGRFTVKMRVGFEDKRHYEALLTVIQKHGIDMLSVHGRTVKQMYRGEVDYEAIALAREHVDCPVFANGNISSCEVAERVYKDTDVYGLMVGRSAIRNPWIFRQIREKSLAIPIYRPRLEDVYTYIERLWDATVRPNTPELYHVGYMKKFLNFIGQGVDPEGMFLKKMRRTQDRSELLGVCSEFLLEGGRAKELFAAEPYGKVLARPNREA